MRTTFRIFFHFGDELALKTKAKKGNADIQPGFIRIHDGAFEETIPASAITEIRMFRFHGAARVIQVDYHGKRIFFAVIRWMAGQFAIINFLATGDAHRRLQEVAPNSLHATSSEEFGRDGLSWKQRIAVFFVFALLAFSTIAVISYFKGS